EGCRGGFRDLLFAIVDNVGTKPALTKLSCSHLGKPRKDNDKTRPYNVNDKGQMTNDKGQMTDYSTLN
ncbi:MAG: hypothetical protein RLP02_28655, partial [Coleofasciculus sp. C2-GNP5-27]